VEDSESVLADTDISVTPSRPRRQMHLETDTEDRQVDSDKLTPADDATEMTEQQDVTVGFYCLVYLIFVLYFTVQSRKKCMSSNVCVGGICMISCFCCAFARPD